MKKAFSILIFGIMLISLLGAVNAQTVVGGTIYDANYQNKISGAHVVVVCNGNTLETNSISDGSYSVAYNTSEECEYGDNLRVDATKGDLSGSAEGTIQFNDVGGTSLDVGIYNVPLVPEFGAIVAGLTILSALGVFFIVRKR